jgi:hypothetical protein
MMNRSYLFLILSIQSIMAKQSIKDPPFVLILIRSALIPLSLKMPTDFKASELKDEPEEFVSYDRAMGRIINSLK